jgi:hypothetical protein
VSLIVLIGITVTRITVFNIVQHNAQNVGSAEALDGAPEQLARGTTCADDNHYPVG